MKNPSNLGSPRKQTQGKKVEYLDVRLNAGEKETFQAACSLAGISLSAWARERLRRAAVHELESAGIEVPFLAHVEKAGQ